MRLAYCEDEKVQLKYMEGLAAEWGRLHQIPMQFTGYESAEEFLFKNGQTLFFDVIFLDIDMKKTSEMDGMALARRIREMDPVIPILFVTNRREYVFEGYEVGAYRYLLKPLDRIKLFGLLDELSRSLKKEFHYILEVIDGEIIKLPLEEICFVEVCGHFLKLKMREGEYSCKQSLQEFRAILQEAQKGAETETFVSTHRSYLVNLAYVNRIGRTDCILADGSSVPVSRNAYQSVNAAFIRYYRGESQ